MNLTADARRTALIPSEVARVKRKPFRQDAGSARASGQTVAETDGMEPLRTSFTVHSFDADAFGELTLPALAGYLQEAAGRSADALGFGLADLHRRGLTWVLERLRLEAPVALRWGDQIAVETWPSGIDRLRALRDFRVSRDGVEVARAISSWLVIDLTSRRPARVEPIFREADVAFGPHLLPVEAPAPVVPEAAAEVDRRFGVRFADIDSNLHVTNASYLTWMAEAVREAGWRAERVAAADVQFLAECRLDTFVRSRSGPLGAGRRWHAVVREDDGRVAARAHLAWVPRTGLPG